MEVKSSPSLRMDKERHVIRLVNATVTKVAYRLSIKPDNLGTNFIISPMSGTIDQESFVYVQVRNLNYTTNADHTNPMTGVALSIKYKRLGVTSSEPNQVYGKIGINMVAQNTDNEYDSFRFLKSDNIYCLIFRVIRATLLLALITYNVVLISKYEIFRR